MRACLLSLGLGLLASLGFAQEKDDKEPPPAELTPERGITGLREQGGAKAVTLGRYHALLIGIDAYEHHARLETPLKDVAAIAKVLEKQYAFGSIRILANEQASRVNILRTLRELGKDLTEDDNLLIYYAGHGVQLDDGEAYWIPYGGDDDEENWIAADQVQARIRKFKAKHVLLVADSCFSGALFRTVNPQGQDALDAYLRRLVSLKSREMIASGGKEPVLDRGVAKDHSPFAYYFISALKNNKRNYLTSSQIAAAVARNVSNWSKGRQTPQHNTIGGTDDQSGEFVFALAGADPNVTITGNEDEPALGGRTRGKHVPAGFMIPAGVDAIDANKGLYRSRRDGAEMVLVWPDRFPYGGKKMSISEKTQVRPFLMDRFEVTVERFRKFIKTDGMPREEILFWNHSDYSKDDQPVIGVNIDHARQYAKWAGKRVPSEVYWEYAAAWDRVEQGHRAYPWGNQFETIKIAPVVRLPSVKLALQLGDVSPSGVCGMGSGVREWCEPAIGADLPVIRGGSQFSRRRPRYMKATTRERWPTRVSPRSNDVGFRCIIFLN